MNLPHQFSLYLHHPEIFQVPGGVNPPHVFWHVLGLATPPGLGPPCRLLALGVGLPEDLGLSVHVRAVEGERPDHLPPVGKATDPPLGLRLAADGLAPGVGDVGTAGWGLG